MSTSVIDIALMGGPGFDFVGAADRTRAVMADAYLTLYTRYRGGVPTSKSNRRPHANTFLRRARALGYQFGAADARDGVYRGARYGSDPLINAFFWGYCKGHDAFDDGRSLPF